MTIPHWASDDKDSLWDFLMLGGRFWPGLWKVDCSKSRAVDKAKAAGVDGYTLTNKGYAGAPFKATGRLWTSEQIQELQTILPDFDPEWAGVSTPLDVYHPTLDLMQVGAAYLSKIEIKGPEQGILTITLDLDQWFPITKPAKSASKPKGFDGAAGANAPLNPEDFRLDPPGV